MYEEHSSEIKNTISHYFQGIYNGGVEKLESVFHPEALLSGDIKGDPYFKTLSDYIDGVRNRKSPSELGEDFQMKILGIEILGNTAIAKLTHAPMLGYNYHDFLSLSMVNGEWKIVNKLFSHVE